MNRACRLFARTAKFLAHCALASALCAGIGVVQAHAATITVTGTADGTLAELTGNGTCDLREAIEASNTDTAVGECAAGLREDTIAFSIGGGGLQTISPLSELPTITDPVVIDGTTQLSCGDTPCIEIDGSKAGLSPGLSLSGGGSTIRGLVINSFSGAGIHLHGAGGNLIHGNFIGTDATGSIAKGNGHGVLIDDVGFNIVGTDPELHRNLISGNHGDGVRITGAGASYNKIWNNYIGTDASGNSALPNDQNGIGIVNASATIIGGGFLWEPWARNLISGNGRGSSGYGVAIEGEFATENEVLGNYIGTDVSGQSALGNNLGGVLVLGSENRVGWYGDGRNLISGNGKGSVPAHGVTVGGVQNVVAANYIGTDISGEFPLKNSGNGVYIFGSYSYVRINRVAFNGSAGIEVKEIDQQSTVANLISANAVFENQSLGIDLNGDGVTANDELDTDIGPNDLQNYPVLYKVLWFSHGLQFSGELRSKPNTTFELEVFSSPNVDPSGFGEGRTYIGSLYVTTDANGYVSGREFLEAEVPQRQFYTMTARQSQPWDVLHSTSEFSAAVQDIDGPSELNVITVTGTDDSWSLGELDGNGTCDLREAISASNEDAVFGECPAGDGIDLIAFDIGDGGHQVIGLDDLSLFPEQPVIIDGFTQPGCDGPCIEIRGSGMSHSLYGSTGLAVLADDTTVRGLVINNFDVGIKVWGDGVVVEGNYIGTDVTGTQDQGNNWGILIIGSNDSRIGGTLPGAGNTIAFNHEMGIGVLEKSQGPGVHIDILTKGARIVGNTIYANGGLGIDLLWANVMEWNYEFFQLGVTPNDVGDIDEGSNNYQNFPVFTTAVRYGETLVVAGYLESTADTEFEVDFYANEQVHASGHGEGKTYLGQTIVTSDDQGSTEFLVSFPVRPETALYVTATAADPEGNTSEFSEAIEVVVADPIALHEGPKPKKMDRAERKGIVQQRY